MGDFEQGNSAESVAYNPNAGLKSSIVLLFGLFAPIAMTIMTWGMFPEITIQSMLWMYYPSSYYNSGFVLMPPYAFFSMFPFLLLRMAPVTMMHRYYNGKTTRKRAAIASAIGDGLFLFMGLPTLIFGIMFMSGYFIIPLPIQMIVALLILWRSPLPEPTTPWDDVLESKSWWEKSPEAQRQMKLDDDDDVLW